MELETKSKYTPEPWSDEHDPLGYVGERRIWSADGRNVATIRPVGGPESTLANARRIVACVNALKGVPTEQLEYFVAHDEGHGVLKGLFKAYGRERTPEEEAQIKADAEHVYAEIEGEKRITAALLEALMDWLDLVDNGIITAPERQAVQSWDGDSAAIGTAIKHSRAAIALAEGKAS